MWQLAAGLRSVRHVLSARTLDLGANWKKSLGGNNMVILLRRSIPIRCELTSIFTLFIDNSLSRFFRVCRKHRARLSPAVKPANM